MKVKAPVIAVICLVLLSGYALSSLSEPSKEKNVQLQHDIFVMTMPASQLAGARVLADGHLTVLMDNDQHFSMALHTLSDSHVDEEVFGQLPQLLAAENLPSQVPAALVEPLKNMRHALRRPLGQDIEVGEWRNEGLSVHYLLGAESAILLVKADHESAAYAQISLHQFSPEAVKAQFSQSLSLAGQR